MYRSTNPYQPPQATDGDGGSAKTAVRRASTICIPPLLAIGGTLIFWLGLASVLDKTVASFDNRSLMIIWSTSLFLSVVVSVYLVIRVWPDRLSPVSMGAGFVFFGLAFWLLEGDTSNGTDLIHMSILYGTLTAVPVLVFVMTQGLGRRRRAEVTESVGE